MTNEDLARIEARSQGSLGAAAMASEIRLAWRVLDQTAQARVDQDKVITALRAALWQVREMSDCKVAKDIAAKALAAGYAGAAERQAGMPVVQDHA